MPYASPPELGDLSLDQIATLVAERKLPPLDQWAPAGEGDSRMRIAGDGTWFHDGGKITRPAMIRAFASLLTRDAAGAHWLMTPHEKLSIAVADAAFIAVDVVQAGGGLAFRLNTDDLVIAGSEHALTARGTLDAPAIYLAVRHGTEARLNRSTWAQLAEIMLAGDGASVTSQGVRFALVPE